MTKVWKAYLEKKKKNWLKSEKTSLFRNDNKHKQSQIPKNVYATSTCGRDQGVKSRRTSTVNPSVGYVFPIIPIIRFRLSATSLLLSLLLSVLLPPVPSATHMEVVTFVHPQRIEANEGQWRPPRILEYDYNSTKILGEF